MSDNKKILISGYYGFDNSGDDAILKAIIKDIKSIDETIEITALSKNPLNTKKIYKVNAVDRFNFNNVINAIRNNDMLISGGGSLLQDITSTRSILYYLALIHIAKLYKKPVMVYANGIGPIYKKYNRILTRNILNKVDLITLRDSISKETVKNLGVSNKNVYVTADPVFTLDPIDDRKVLRIFKEENISYSKPLIGIAVREWKNTENIIKILSETINYINTKYDCNILLIPMHYPEDLNISKKIKEEVNSDVYIINNKYSVEEMMGIINKLEMIIAMRLHSLIYAASRAIPMVGIVYDPKVDGFMDSIEQKNKIPVEELDIESMIKAVDNVWNNKNDIKDKLSKLKCDFKDKALSNVYKALTLLEK